MKTLATVCLSGSALLVACTDNGFAMGCAFCLFVAWLALESLS
jgi:hypothetical protein